MDLSPTNLRRGKVAVLMAASFVFGMVVSPALAGTALAPITLQPGDSITIIAASPTPSPSLSPSPTDSSTATASPTASVTPAPTATPVPTVAPTATPVPVNYDPSGQAMPVGDLVGWHQVFADNFSTESVPLGSWPGNATANWSAYPSTWHDTTGHGMYNCLKVCSIKGGILDMYLHNENGTNYVAAPVPKIPGSLSSTWGDNLYERISVRFRGDALYGYKTAWLLWPQSGTWPYDGEIDFPEGDLTKNISAFMHHMYATSGSQQDAFSTTATFTGWHTATTEWTATYVAFYLDGILIGKSTAYIPNTPMHYVIQTETSTDGQTPASTTAGHVQLDWVTVYRPF